MQPPSDNKAFSGSYWPFRVASVGAHGVRPSYLCINQTTQSSDVSCPWVKRLSAAKGKCQCPSRWGNKGFIPERGFWKAHHIVYLLYLRKEAKLSLIACWVNVSLVTFSKSLHAVGPILLICQMRPDRPFSSFFSPKDQDVGQIYHIDLSHCVFYSLY